jgi:hypothetical protein
MINQIPDAPLITRSPGVHVGGFNPGGGRTGFTPELDATIIAAAEALTARYSRGVQVRFNSDRMSGGAFLEGLSGSVGITAALRSLSHARRLANDTRFLDDSYEEICERWGVDHGGAETQIAHAVFIDASHLIDRTIAECGPETSRYSYLSVAGLPAALDVLRAKAAIPESPR